MKKLLLFMLALFLGLTISNCIKGPDPTNLIKLSTNLLEFSSSGDHTQCVTIQSTTIWLLIPSDNIPNWLTLHPIMGAGASDNLTITVADANGTGTTRECELVFRTIHGGSAVLKIVQPAYTGALHSITVQYTNNNTKTVYATTLNNIVFNTNGPGSVVKSIKEPTLNGGNPVLIGRKEGETVRLSFDSKGSLRFREGESGHLLVGSYAELQLINNARDKKYMQEADLDLLYEEWSPIGYYNPVTSSFNYFSGVYNGNGYVIHNLYVDRRLEDFSGLFGYVAGDIDNVHITSGSIRGRDYTGAICGFLGFGAITNCSNSAAVHGRIYTGGILGYNYYGEVKASCNNGAVTGASTVGGIVGNNQSGHITAVYNSGSILGGDYSGGIIGINQRPGTVVAGYNIGTVRENFYTCGLVGKNTGTVTASYWKKGQGANYGVIDAEEGYSTHIYSFDNTFNPAGIHPTWGIGTGGNNGWWKNYDGNHGLPQLWWER